MTGDLRTKVLEWLNQQGYPLEMRVARELQTAGFGNNLTIGSFYEDLQTGKDREVDVIAYHVQTGLRQGSITSFALLVLLLVECKKSTKPWIGFVVEDNPLNANEMASVYHWPMTKVARDRVADHLMLNWDSIGARFFAPGPTAYGLAEARLGERRLDEKPVSNRSGTSSNRAFDALRQLLDAVEGRLKMAEDVESKTNQADHQRGTVCVPVIVLDGPLFECRLSGGELSLTEVNRTTVVLRDRFVGFGVPRVTVVTADQVEGFAQSAFSLASAISGSAQWWIDQRLDRSQT